MEKNELYEFAEREGIIVSEFGLPLNKSLSHMTNEGDCYIGIDTHAVSECEEKVMLAHEIGHCVTGSFYNKYSKLDIVSRHEYRANRDAIKRLISKRALHRAVKDGYVGVWELAEFFDVTEDFMREAIRYYNEEGR